MKGKISDERIEEILNNGHGSQSEIYWACAELKERRANDKETERLSDGHLERLIMIFDNPTLTPEASRYEVLSMARELKERRANEKACVTKSH